MLNIRAIHAHLRPLIPLLALSTACTFDATGLGSAGPSTGVTATDDPNPNPPTTSPHEPTSSTSPSTSTSALETGTTTDEGAWSTSAADPADTSSSSGDAPSFCGDGVVDRGEACDLGHEHNADDAACTLDCQNAKCGDGKIEAGKEKCDSGPDNNDNFYGGCTTTCSLAAHCGDGVVNGPEECDLGKKNGTGEKNIDGIPCSQTCRHDGLIAFLSSVAYTGGQLNGAQGADYRCQELAQLAGLDNAKNFRAWISDNNSSPSTRFSPPIPGLPYALINGLRVADDRAKLMNQGPIVGITMTETGENLLEESVWTNTTTQGKLAGDSLECMSWTSSSFAHKGRIGRSGVDKADTDAWQHWKLAKLWTEDGTLDCNLTGRLYCLEQ